MKLKSLMLGSAATLVAVAGAQAADLPSKKAAPATYVKVCDAYGAGFFVIPGTDTCVKVGGYVRAEYQYTPATRMYDKAGNEVTTITNAIAGNNNAGPTGIATPRDVLDTTGFEIRGRIDVDARTPTAMGAARTFVRLRAANQSGIRRATVSNYDGYGNGAAQTGITLESAMVQWAGFTFGVAPENYAMMPSMMYNSNPWTGFPNGMNQLAYTAALGGGLSATVAVEDRNMHNALNSQYNHTPGNGFMLVGNVRLDQSWGFAALHAMVGANSYAVNANGVALTAGYDATALGPHNTGAAGNATNVADTRSTTGWAVGSTVSFRLPMIAPGDQVWLTANYSDGQLSALLSNGGLSTVSTAGNARMLGGLVRVDNNMIAVDSSGTNGTADTVRNVTGWNVAGAFTHYWAKQWRSNFSAGYVEINPPTQRGGDVAWGKGRLQVYSASIIYSPVANLDIGLEAQYANLQSRLQNDPVATGHPGLNESNWTTKLRVERSF